MGLENLKSAFSQITKKSQIGGRHGGLTNETPSQPPHQDWHSILDDINPYTNQFIYNYQYKNPNKGGLHGANIEFDGTPVLSTPYYEIDKMTTSFGMIGSEVNFLSKLKGINSYFEPVGRIPGFNNNFDKGGYTFADGQIGNSKYIGIKSNIGLNTPDENWYKTDFTELPNYGGIPLAEPQIHPLANDLFQLNQYGQLNLSDIVDNWNILPESTKLYDNRSYDPRIETMYFGKIVPIQNINNYYGSQFDDGVGGLFNTVQNTSDVSKKYSTTFRTINIPSGFVITNEDNEVIETSGRVFKDGNITTGEGYPQQNIAFEKFESAFALGEPIRYSDAPNSFELNLPVPNTPLTNDFVEIRQNTLSKMGENDKIFETFYNDNHTPKDTKYGPGNVKAKLSLQSDKHNSGYRGTEPYIISSVGNDDTKNASRYWQFSRSIIDEKRIFEFMKSEAGLWFIAKQNLLGLNTRVIVEDDSPVSAMNLNSMQSKLLGIDPPVTKATGQRFKRWYSPLSTMASAFRIGGGGFPNVMVDREFPFGELAGLLGASTTYSDFIRNRRTPGNINNIGGTALSDRNYHLENTFTQPNSDSLGFLGRVGREMAEAVPGLQNSPKDPPKLGDKMTLADYTGPVVLQNSALSFGTTIAQTNADNPILKELDKEKNGMPFYFRDMRTNKYLIFRAYLTGITENIAPSWNSETYIGRSEPVYIYDKTERDVSLTLQLHAGTSGELSAIYKKMNLLTSLCYPQYKNDITFADKRKNTQSGNVFSTGAQTSGLTSNMTSHGKMRMKPPLTMMRMGELYGSKNHELMGFVKSLTYSFPDNATWETIQGKRVPKLITVAMTYQVVHASVPGIQFNSQTGDIATTRFFGYGGDSHKKNSALNNKIQPDIVYETSKLNN